MNHESQNLQVKTQQTASADTTPPTPAPNVPAEQVEPDTTIATAPAEPTPAEPEVTPPAEQVPAESSLTPQAETDTPQTPDRQMQQLIEQARKEAYARGRAEAVDEYLNPTPFFSGLHGAETAIPADPDLQRILQTRKHVW